jgi:hypothetical protein
MRLKGRDRRHALTYDTNYISQKISVLCWCSDNCSVFNVHPASDCKVLSSVRTGMEHNRREPRVSPGGEKMVCPNGSGRHDGGSSTISPHSTGMELADDFPNKIHRCISILAAITVRFDV